MLKSNKEALNPLSYFKPTIGEKIIEQYLYEEGIKYEIQKNIYNLNGDTKSFRKVDFFLPKLNVYVEYYGMYFSGDKYKKEYDIKTKVYLKNSLPTVFIYPNEIGNVDFVFHNKLMNLLSYNKFKNKRIQRNYLINRFIKAGGLALLFISLAIIAVSFYIKNIEIDTFKEQFSQSLFGIGFGFTILFIHQLWYYLLKRL